jgi:sulfite reductase (NADPH) flavoprotein alpha-component
MTAADSSKGPPPVPYVPDGAPFTLEQRAWLNGYLAGRFSDARGGSASAAPAPQKQLLPLTILFGSQTGTAEQLAKRLGAKSKEKGFAPRLLEANALSISELAKTERLLFVTSTWGDGEPPDNANALFAALHAAEAPQLPNLAYAVLALGDKNYSDFCGAGKKFDERLAALGAKRVCPRVDCDTDYETAAAEWMATALAGLPSEPSGKNESPAPDVSAPEKTGPLRYDRKNPFKAKLIASRVLNRGGGAKETRHIEISLEGSGLNYEVGDALGVMPMNCPSLAGEILELLGCDGEEAVPNADDAESSLRHALQHSYQITQPTTALLKEIAARAGAAGVPWAELLAPEKKSVLDAYVRGREVVDFLKAAPSVKFAPKEFVALLQKLQPRLYSISSSPKAHPGEVHLTVGAVRYEAHGRVRKGVCSTFLADRVEAGGAVPVFIQTSHGFRLPSDPNTPIIMVGPGTGIAPFRAFLEERRATGAPGKNWLFFGDQQRACDFLYEEQLTEMAADGFLRLDLAFSRDQAEKIYVQQRMLENAAELWKWLEQGAHFYVCGDAKRMARDVDAALQQAIQTAGAQSADEAAAYVQRLKTAKRYQRDVY